MVLQVRNSWFLDVPWVRSIARKAGYNPMQRRAFDVCHTILESIREV